MVRDAIKRYVEAAQSLTEVPRERAEQIARTLAVQRAHRPRADPRRRVGPRRAEPREPPQAHRPRRPRDPPAGLAHRVRVEGRGRAAPPAGSGARDIRAPAEASAAGPQPSEAQSRPSRSRAVKKPATRPEKDPGSPVVRRGVSWPRWTNVTESIEAEIERIAELPPPSGPPPSRHWKRACAPRSTTSPRRERRPQRPGRPGGLRLRLPRRQPSSSARSTRSSIDPSRPAGARRRRVHRRLHRLPAAARRGARDRRRRRLRRAGLDAPQRRAGPRRRAHERPLARSRRARRRPRRPRRRGPRVHLAQDRRDALLAAADRRTRISSSSSSRSSRRPARTSSAAASCAIPAVWTRRHALGGDRLPRSRVRAGRRDRVAARRPRREPRVLPASASRRATDAGDEPIHGAVREAP